MNTEPTIEQIASLAAQLANGSERGVLEFEPLAYRALSLWEASSVVLERSRDHYQSKVGVAERELQNLWGGPPSMITLNKFTLEVCKAARVSENLRTTDARKESLLAFMKADMIQRHIVDNPHIGAPQIVSFFQPAIKEVERYEKHKIASTTALNLGPMWARYLIEPRFPRKKVQRAASKKAGKREKTEKTSNPQNGRKRA